MTHDFRLVEECRVRAGGKSTCYLNFNRSREWMMAVNYWDAKVSLVKLSKDGRVDVEFEPDPKSGAPATRGRLRRTDEPDAGGALEVSPALAALALLRHRTLRRPRALRRGPRVWTRCFTYRVNNKTGVLVPKGSTRLTPGKGPRHLLFHPTIKCAVPRQRTGLDGFRVSC
jgi:hypothetical protein